MLKKMTRKPVSLKVKKKPQRTEFLMDVQVPDFEAMMGIYVTLNNTNELGVFSAIFRGDLLNVIVEETQ